MLSFMCRTSPSRWIYGNKTDIVISKYEGSFMVMVTQIGCMGTILAARKDESVFSDPTYNVLFGKRDEPLLLACARQLIEHIRYYLNFPSYDCNSPCFSPESCQISKHGRLYCAYQCF
ncbi:uncharacterized protein LOC127760319 isoform X1 [Oryza glaberrima]|uniref:uncharacterized protein LOC127760319 isoform X1 n=1 Tax=Oryza glaberrima TaxID=4538 RepID=UPI00224C3ECE|nr:uncharacterized protein LOC127760319 isoform X1 [Oryza glaberrima]XP_052140521.1 uncharacterized protein LOC127760319 isoform X1 [Oryza glaberrima]